MLIINSLFLQYLLIFNNLQPLNLLQHLMILVSHFKLLQCSEPVVLIPKVPFLQTGEEALAVGDFAFLDQTAAGGVFGLEVPVAADRPVVFAPQGVVPLDSQVYFGWARVQVLKRAGVEDGTDLVLEFYTEVHYLYFIN